MARIILYLATSADGFIARENLEVDWLDPYSREDYGYQEFYDSVGAIIVGRTTDEQFPEAHEGKDCYVFSRTKKGTEGNRTYVEGDVEEFVRTLKKDAWLVGGADLARQFMQHDLIDEYIITVIPIMLGSGIPLFGKTGTEIPLKLLGSQTYDSGVVQVRYGRS